jgi:fructose-bisphosphate aldolase, class II
MPLVHMRDMLNHAYRNNYAVGGFDLVSLDFLEAILEAGERCRSPLILSLAESHFEYYDFELAMAATERAARRATIPVAIHLDHGTFLDSAVRAINLGCNGVMVDASNRPFDENAALTRTVVEMARGCGVPVEGELGYVAGVEGEDAEKHPGEVVYTAPEEAHEFVERTGVDCLAVSVGTVHGRLRGEPQLDFDRLARINETLGLPLVIHGGTGLGDEQFRRLIANGVAKINYYTALADAAGARIRANAEGDAGSGYTGLLKGVRAAIAAEVERCMRLWGSAGRADAVLAECRAWRPVEHVIVYNVSGADDGQVEAMMARGREMLATIPGVRRVFTGWAVTEGAKYRFCWLVQFAHENVIASYRDHPVHVAFADEWFRPIAGDRISIDYAGVGDNAADATRVM